MDDLYLSFFTFTTFIEKLKKIERFKNQFYWRDYPRLKRYESVADHSWRLAILILLFENRLARKINIQKAIKMALVHDLPEVLAGDAHPMEGDGTGNLTYAKNESLKVKKQINETKAAKKLFQILPSDEAKHLLELWTECEEQASFEAKVVKALDKIECLLQVFEYRRGHMFKTHLEFSLEYGLRSSNVDPAIYQFGKLIENKMNIEFKEFKKDKKE